MNANADGKILVAGASRGIGLATAKMLLKRGYGVVQKADAVVTSAGDVRQGDSISIEMKDGRILASVSGVLGTDGEEKNDV